MTRAPAVIAAGFCLLAAACNHAPQQTADEKAVDTGLHAWFVVERELMLVDERLQMQAIDGALSGGDAPTQLKSAAQVLLTQPTSKTTLQAIVTNQQAAAQAYFAFVDAAIAQASDSGWRTYAAARLTQIRADYAADIKARLDPAQDLANAYEMLAHARGVDTEPMVTPFDNARADADALLPASPSLPPPASAQPVTPLPPSG